MFTNQDLIAIEQHGITKEALQRQIAVIAHTKQVELLRPVLKNDGLLVLSEDELARKEENYARQTESKRIVKFVPASGAASRMFKSLFNFLNNNDFSAPVEEVAGNLSSFAFFESLAEALKASNLDISQLLENKDYKTIFSFLLENKGLNYASLPKALLAFHRYEEQTRTALDEHLVEAAAYACGKDKTAHLHFTVSPEHYALFQKHVQKILKTYESLLQVKFDISFSFQDSSTDTVAFDYDNQPFRTDDGQLVFRPGGHGSLIKNLNHLNADIAFIKNIDNVTLDELKPDTIKYKKVLGSLLVDFQEKTFDILRQLQQNNKAQTLKEAEELLQQMFVRFDNSYQTLSLEEKRQHLFRLLDRPIRICGVVKQTGEPGGGPFWVKNEKGVESMQIVESSEMNLKNPQQQEIFEQSKFFNPVDIVCSLKHFDGSPFDFEQYIDYDRFFVSSKSLNGKNLKAIENPGLWNGAMSDWLTVFVAVPLSTFSPVKTINDLLHKEHLGKK
ncbi:MAG: DUF4301 family protein [Bacteroidales bacterium]|nr:DUF4301 family protein [Bacteroidales bacterium]